MKAVQDSPALVTYQSRQFQSTSRTNRRNSTSSRNISNAGTRCRSSTYTVHVERRSMILPTRIELWQKVCSSAADSVDMSAWIPITLWLDRSIDHAVLYSHSSSGNTFQADDCPTYQETPCLLQPVNDSNITFATAVLPRQDLS